MRIHLQDGEQIVHTEHLSLTLVWVPCVFGVALLLGSSFFFYPFLQFGTAGLVPIAALALFGFFLMARGAARWRGSACVLTNQRILRVEQRGWLDRTVASAPLQAIQDVAYRTSGWKGTFLHIGSVRVTFRGVLPTMHFRSVVRPNVLHDLVSELHTLSLESAAPPTDFSRVHMQRLS